MPLSGTTSNAECAVAGKGGRPDSLVAQLPKRDHHFAGHRVVMVSSGAQGVGCKRLGLPVKPTGLAQKQACAAVGQPHLMRFYDDFFSALGLVRPPPPPPPGVRPQPRPLALAAFRGHPPAHFSYTCDYCRLVLR